MGMSQGHAGAATRSLGRRGLPVRNAEGGREEPAGADLRRNEVASLRNGLLALLALNKAEALSASQLAIRLGLSRTSARRILDTLAAAHLVDKLDHDATYHLAPEAADLSAGLSLEHVLSHFAGPLLRGATDQFGWTLSLVTVCGTHIVLRVCTQKRAAHAVTFFRRGNKIPIMASQAGRLAMSYLTEEERRTLIDRVSEETGQPVQDPFATPAEAAAIREAGFYIPEARNTRESHLHVPIFINGRAPAGLIMRYFVAAVSMDELERRYVPLLKSLSKDISDLATSSLKGREPHWVAQLHQT